MRLALVIDLARVEPVILVWLALLGACVGSFLNVCVFRLPRACLSVARPPRSFCPRCRRQLSWYENVPIVSWAVQRGRCRGCATPISLRYPLVEAATMAIFAWLAWRDLAGRIDDPGQWGLFLIHAALCSALLVCTLVDLEFRIIPDEIDVPGLLLAPLAVALVPAALAAWPDLAGAASWLHERLDSPLAWWGAPEGALGPLLALARMPGEDPGLYPHLAAFAGSVLGAACGAFAIYGIGVVGSRAFGREAMGFGDVKYMALLGGFAGWQGVLSTLLVACLAGSVWGIAAKVWSGRTEVRGRDIDEATPLGRLALLVAGARGPAGPDEVVPIRRGTGLFARLATGDPYIAFGPCLTVGGVVAIFWPEAVPAALAAWSGR